MVKLKMILSMTKWLLHPRYIHLRLYTMYGSKYYIYILRHPIRFIKDLNKMFDLSYHTKRINIIYNRIFK